jgi:thymidine kinase
VYIILWILRGGYINMPASERRAETEHFLKSLGFPSLQIHHSYNHYDFTRKNMRILIIGPMGSGKTELAARIFRDSQVALRKSKRVELMTTEGEADRRIIFYIRSKIDRKRFPDYPEDALAYRGGYERMGKRIGSIENSFELEKLIAGNRDAGTWIIDEAGFFDERIAYVIQRSASACRMNFIFPMLILNFRKNIFNRTARLLMEGATDIFPLTAYCEHEDCITDSYYTYRSYTVEARECPALYFDPLIIVGGDRVSSDPRMPNYSTRCDAHHYLPGKEYTFLILKPLGELAYAGNTAPLVRELKSMKNGIAGSEIYGHFTEKYLGGDGAQPIMMNALQVPCIAEKALIYLFAEENLLSLGQVKAVAAELSLDMGYVNDRLLENRRLKVQ